MPHSELTKQTQFVICHSNNKYLTAAIFVNISPKFYHQVIYLQFLQLSSNDSFHEDYFSLCFFLTFQNFIPKNMASLEQMYLISMELRSSGQKLESPLEIPFLGTYRFT